MKKYIRTKDGIYERAKHAYSYWGNLNEDKQADTIEELCDEFIGINDNEHQFLRAIPYKCSNYWNNGIYGAIWTNRGLLYVAKLNEQGKLELI